MIGVVIALVLAGPSLGGTPPTLQSGPVISGPADVNPFLPLFEFAPASGVGIGAATCDCNSANLATFPQDLDNAVWALAGLTSAAPVVTANWRVPDPVGAFGAERVQFDSCAGANTASQMSQVGMGFVGTQTNTASVFCRGTYASQTISICAFNGDTTTGQCSSVTCSATAWTRVTQSLSSTTTGGIVLGCINRAIFSGGSNTGTADVLLWGGDYTAGSFQPYTAVPEANTGATMVFSRTSTATCLKTIGISSQTVANGDMVTCATGQPRMMPGADGSPDAGLLVEGARTNSLLRSQELDNAAWTTLGAGGPAAPTVTADAAIAPDGTTTAERVQVAACNTGGGASIVFQNYTGTAAAWAGTMWFKGNGTSGNISLQYFDSTAVAGTWVSCPFVSTGWTRCEVDRTFANATHRLSFGCNNNPGIFPGASNTGAADVFAWGGDSEAGAFASSYIATTSAAITRSEEAFADFPLSISLPVGYSIAANVTGATSANTGAPRLHGTVGNGVAGAAGGSSSYDDSFYNGQWDAETTATTPTNSLLTTSLTNGSRWVTYYDGAVLGACKDGACATVVATYLAPTWTRWRAGAYTSGNGLIFGVIKYACLDASPTRCR